MSSPEQRPHSPEMYASSSPSPPTINTTSTSTSTGSAAVVTAKPGCLTPVRRKHRLMPRSQRRLTANSPTIETTTTSTTLSSSSRNLFDTPMVDPHVQALLDKIASLTMTIKFLEESNEDLSRSLRFLKKKKMTNRTPNQERLYAMEMHVDEVVRQKQDTDTLVTKLQHDLKQAAEENNRLQLRLDEVLRQKEMEEAERIKTKQHVFKEVEKEKLKWVELEESNQMLARQLDEMTMELDAMKKRLQHERHDQFHAHDDENREKDGTKNTVDELEDLKNALKVLQDEKEALTTLYTDATNTIESLLSETQVQSTVPLLLPSAASDTTTQESTHATTIADDFQAEHDRKLYMRSIAQHVLRDLIDDVLEKKYPRTRDIGTNTISIPPSSSTPHMTLPPSLTSSTLFSTSSTSFHLLPSSDPFIFSSTDSKIAGSKSTIITPEGPIPKFIITSLCGLFVSKSSSLIGHRRWRVKWVSYNPWLRIFSWSSGPDGTVKVKKMVVVKVRMKQDEKEKQGDGVDLEESGSGDGFVVCISGVDGKEVVVRQRKDEIVFGELVKALLWRG